MWNLMLFSDSSAALTLSTRRALPAQRLGIVAEEKPSVYARILSEKKGAATKTEDPPKEESSKETGGFQQFGKQLKQMWRRWKKPLLIVGSMLATGTLGVVAYWGAIHIKHENVKTSLLSDREEITMLWQRFEDFRAHINQQNQAQASGNGQIHKIKGGYDLVGLFQDALDIEKFIYNEVSDANRKTMASKIIKTVLDYALEFEPDVLPVMLRGLHKSQRLTSILDEKQVQPIETPFRNYIKRHRNSYLSDDLLKAPFARYENDRRAIEAFRAFDDVKDAKHAVLQARLFQQRRKANEAESNFEIACMLDLYTTYLKVYYPYAYEALAPLAEKIVRKDPNAASTLTPEDLNALSQATHLTVELYPWQDKEESIYFSQGLRDLMYKILSKQDISPQNYGYHKKIYGS
jgi:hypothetical protein